MSAAHDLSTSYLGLRTMRDGLIRWMDVHGYATPIEVRGRLSLSNCPDPAAFERANYIRTLSSWTRPGTALTAHR